MLWFSQKGREKLLLIWICFKFLQAGGFCTSLLYCISATKVGITRMANAFDVLEYSLYIYAWMRRINCKWPKCFMRSRGLISFLLNEKKRPWKSKKVDGVEVSRILSNQQEQPRQLWDQILLYWHGYLIEVLVFLAFRDEEDGLFIISCKYLGPCSNRRKPKLCEYCELAICVTKSHYISVWH